MEVAFRKLQYFLEVPEIDRKTVNKDVMKTFLWNILLFI